MSKRKTRKAHKAAVAMVLPPGTDADNPCQQFMRWQEEQRFLIERDRRLAEKARELGILPHGPIEPPTKH